MTTETPIPTIHEPDTDTITIPRIEYVVVSDTDLEKPYRVVIENDEVTPMDFVVEVLRVHFGLQRVRAIAIMLTAHHEGHALVGVYPFEEAQDRVYAAHNDARNAGYPLSFYLEPDE